MCYSYFLHQFRGVKTSTSHNCICKRVLLFIYLFILNDCACDCACICACVGVCMCVCMCDFGSQVLLCQHFGPECRNHPCTVPGVHCRRVTCTRPCVGGCLQSIPKLVVRENFRTIVCVCLFTFSCRAPWGPSPGAIGLFRGWVPGVVS